MYYVRRGSTACERWLKSDCEGLIRDETGACMPLDPPVTQKVAGECVIEVGNCDTYGHEWTALMNTDDPWTDSGDFELLKNIQGICANPTGIRAVAPDTGMDLRTVRP